MDEELDLCENCGEEIEPFCGIEEVGFIFCSQTCADEWLEDEDDEDWEDEEDPEDEDEAEDVA